MTHAPVAALLPTRVDRYAKHMDNKYNVTGKAQVVDVEKFTKMLQVRVHTYDKRSR